MNILIVAFTFPPDTNGVSYVAYQHAIGLSKKGYNVEVVTTFSNKRENKFIDDIKINEFKITGNGLLVNPFRGEINKYQEFIKKNNYDLIYVHAWESWPSELILPLISSLKTPVVLVSHGTSFNWLTASLWGFIRWILYRPYAWTLKNKMQLFSHFVFLSSIDDKVRFSDVRMVRKLNLKNYTVIANGCTSTLYTKTKSESSFREKYKIIQTNILLCVSNYIPSKGQDIILKAFQELSLIDTALVFIGGEKNKFCKSLERQIQKKNLNNVYIMHNIVRDDIYEAYLDSTLFVTATKTECQPLMLLDAMAAGLPFIAPNVGCIREFKGGVVYENFNKLKSSILSLLQNEQLRFSLSIEGKKQARNQYYWQNIIEDYASLTQKLVNVG